MAAVLDLAEVVRHYRANHSRAPVGELQYFAKRRTFSETVEAAAMCKIERKKLSHQRRIPEVSLSEARDRLLGNLAALRAPKTFDELHDAIEAMIRPIPKIGELAVYDITLRIGARFGIEPDKVYLHRGTRDGAKALGLAFRKATLEIHEFPNQLRVLTAREIEDVLCIYKDYFATGKAIAIERTCRTAATAAGPSRC